MIGKDGNSVLDLRTEHRAPLLPRVNFVERLEVVTWFGSASTFSATYVRSNSFPGFVGWSASGEAGFGAH